MKIKITAQGIMGMAWFLTFVYLLVSTSVIGILGVGGLAYMIENNPDAFNDSWLSYDFFWYMIMIQPIIIIGLFVSFIFMDMTFKLPFRKKKKDA